MDDIGSNLDKFTLHIAHVGMKVVQQEADLEEEAEEEGAEMSTDNVEVVPLQEEEVALLRSKLARFEALFEKEGLTLEQAQQGQQQ